ncbi:MAG: L-glutamine--2-deoxy-scyllo-inosose aminotransferase KanB, partial [Lutimonas sp.]
IRRMNEFIAIQRRNHGILKEALSQIPEVSFRRIPDPEGDSCGFLNFFMPTADMTSKVVQAFKDHGIDSFWNYYENNWHYVRRWDHLKNAKSLFPISDEVRSRIEGIKDQKFPQSDDLMSRNISCLIKLSWEEQQVRDLGKRMAEAIRSVL